MANDVTFKIQDYVAHEDQVFLVNQVFHGVDTAKDLMIQLSNEADDSFVKRVEEATLDNYIERIVKSMSGQVLRKSLTYDDVDDSTIEATERISGNDNLDQFAKNITELGIRDGKAFVLVDVSTEGGDPYFSAIERSQVTNWRKNSEGIFTMVVIKEGYSIDNGFEVEYDIQYRVIDEVGNVTIWRAGTENKSSWYIYEEITTSYNFCPFYELFIDNVPPLYDIARVNAKHMNFTSLRDRFCRECLDPILFAKSLGIGEEDEINLSVNNMMATDNSEATLEWVEVNGSNYEVSKDLLNTLEDDMSARALKVQADSNVKTATEVQSDNAEGTARLSDIAEDLESVLNLSLNAYTQIKMNKDIVGKVLVSRDFNKTVIDGTTLGNLNTIRVTGGMSLPTFVKAINESEIVNIESVDDEVAAIEEEQIGLEEEVDAGV